MHQLISAVLVSSLLANLAVYADTLKHRLISEHQLTFFQQHLLAQESADSSQCNNSKCPQRGEGRRDRAN